MSTANNDIAVAVRGVSKTFKLPHEKQSSIKGLFVNIFRKSRTFEKQQVLRDISFEIDKGEFFGIVGRNGSGKSTLLKILAGIYTPNSGNVKIDGKLTPFIELGVGFNPELTGRENVYLNGALLGIGRKEMDVLYDEIVEFAELRQFMDQKLNNYSSGMQVRLAFSIAIRAKGDILLLDEVLAVGDAAFQKKCLNYFNELKANKQTVVLVTHDMNSVERFCDRAMLIEKGEIQKIGKSSEVAQDYEEMFIKDDLRKKSDLADGSDIYSEDLVRIEDIRILQKGKVTKKIKAFTPFTVRLTVKSKAEVKNGFIALNIKNYEGRAVAATDTKTPGQALLLKKNKKTQLDFEIENIFTNGTYTLNLGGVDEQNPSKPLISKRPVMSFMVYGVEKYRDSIVHPNIEVKIS